MHILVLGQRGQIAHELITQLASTNHQVSVLARPEIDFSKPDAVTDKLNQLDGANIDVLINGIAYTQVDKAETEMELADAANHLSVDRIAQWCAQNDIWFIHYSTDYVFDGKARAKPFAENDPVAPINTYGKTKLDGENAIIRSGCQYLILRTSWVYADRGSNFLLTMLRLSETRNELDIVDDQQGVPNAAGDLAQATVCTLPFLDKDNRDNAYLSGIYHLTSQPQTTWFGFAQRIFELAQRDVRLNPVTSAAFPTPAKRPLYSVMDNQKFCTTFDYRFDDWQVSLERTLAKISKH